MKAGSTWTVVLLVRASPHARPYPASACGHQHRTELDALECSRAWSQRAVEPGEFHVVPAEAVKP